MQPCGCPTFVVREGMGTERGGAFPERVQVSATGACHQGV